MKAYTKRTWDVKFRHILSYPFIYSPVICFILLDIVIELYHHICFPLYSIPKVDRSKYILIDRHHLSYINFVKKVGCVYCGYVNGLMPYWTEIIGRTEEYWCGIQHENDEITRVQRHHKQFAAYGDAQDLKKKFSVG